MALWMSPKFLSVENQGSIQFFPRGDDFGTKLARRDHGRGHVASGPKKPLGG
jgi:hypothetical protein